jgi:hypothetical protein
LLKYSGEDCDPADIVFNTKRIIKIYEHALKWSQRVKRACGDKRMQPALQAMSKFPGDIIKKIEAFGPHCKSEFEKAKEAVLRGEKIVLNISLILDAEGTEEFHGALRDFERQMNA